LIGGNGGDFDSKYIPELELSVSGKKTLVVCWTAEGFFAAGLEMGVLVNGIEL